MYLCVKIYIHIHILEMSICTYIYVYLHIHSYIFMCIDTGVYRVIYREKGFDDDCSSLDYRLCYRSRGDFAGDDGSDLGCLGRGKNEDEATGTD